MKTFAVLVEYSLPDAAQFDAVVGPMKAALHDLPTSVAPVMVTAFAGENAERIIREHCGE